MTCCHNHTACKTTALTKAETFCTENGLRLTETRRDVLAIIWQSHTALTAHDIMQKLGNSQPPITYRALQFLQENGLIHHIASLNAYIGCPHIGEAHTGQLIICKRCRTVTEIDIPLPTLMQAATRNGFAAEETHIEILGLCQACQSQAS